MSPRELELGSRDNPLVDRAPERVTGLGAQQRELGIGRTRGTTSAGGNAFDVPIAHVWQLRDGLVASVRFYIDNPTMRAALG